MPPPPRTPAQPRTRSLTGTPTADPTTPARIRTPARTRTPDRDPCLDPDPCLAADSAPAPESGSDSRTPGHVDPATGSAPHPLWTPGSRPDATRPGRALALPRPHPRWEPEGLPGGGARGLPASRAGADPSRVPGPAWTRLASAPPPGPVADALVRGRTPGGHRAAWAPVTRGKGGPRRHCCPRPRPGARLEAPLCRALRDREPPAEVQRRGRCALISFLCSVGILQIGKQRCCRKAESPEREAGTFKPFCTGILPPTPPSPSFSPKSLPFQSLGAVPGETRQARRDEGR